MVINARMDAAFQRAAMRDRIGVCRSGKEVIDLERSAADPNDITSGVSGFRLLVKNLHCPFSDVELVISIRRRQR